MNIDGVVRSLALFEPPIDPNALIRAAASGNLGVGGAALTPPAIPYYRFEYMIEKAKSLTGNVIQLGNALLSALEKKDAEALALLRNSQEAKLLALTTSIKENQISEVQDIGIGLEASRDGAQARLDYYTQLIDDGLSPGEQENLDAMAEALAFNILAGVTKTAASIGYAAPQVGSPFAMTYGGKQIGAVLNAASGVFELGSLVSSYVAQRSLTTAGYDRRAAEWELQKTLASYDLQQIEAQIEANGVRLQIAEQELTVHEQQIQDNQATDEFLRRKFTNEELYQWMITQLSTVYFNAYSLAFDMARSAERAYQYQIGTNRAFLDFGYWDSLRKGLTAGDSLLLALERLEDAYLTANSRPFEIERVIPLSQLDPKALLDLKSSGECLFTFSEKLFDDDFPGQYLRRIATLSVSVPAALGPYQNIKATLTQLSNQVVLQPNLDAVAFLLAGGEGDFSPDVLRSNWWPNQQIALSTGVNDAGVFELNFSDPRYLPFENTGAVSSWRLSLPQQTNRFDFEAITDVIFTLRYTAYDGGAKFRSEVVALPELSTYSGAALLPLAQQDPQAWYAFLSNPSDSAEQKLQFTVSPTILPAHVQTPKLPGFYFKLDLAPEVSIPSGQDFITFNVTDDDSVPIQLSANADFSYTFPSPLQFTKVLAGERTITFDLAKTPADLKKDGFLDPEKVLGIGLILDYEGTIDW